MSARSELNAFIRRVQARLRLGALLRGAAILTSVALAVTVLLVFISNLFAFSAGSLTGARILLLIALAFALGFGIALPLYGLDRRRAVGKAEVVFPTFQQRLVTFTERESDRDPFIELLASDTLKIAKQSEPKRLFSDSKLVASLGAGLASLAVLLWMIAAGPGYLGHGASLLWLGAAHSGAPLYDLHVSPGDVTVRRNADQIVTAQIVGLQTSQVRLFARYQSASKWDEVAMQAQPGGVGFQFLFAGLPEGVEYYVEAGPLHSRHFNIRVADLPSVKQIRVTYHFPAWTGLPNAVEERSGDLRAVEGTEADLEVFTDRPLKDGILMFDDSHQLRLSSTEGNVYKGAVKIEKDGLYHVAAIDQGEPVRLSDDYFIEANKANPPDVRIEKPPRDYRASPIEEVTIGINAADEFGLQDMNLHYSVNGGAEQTVNLLKQKGNKEADGSTVLSLEDFKLVPGDLVSLYATAKDAHAESRSDIYFIQVDPFEREFSQSQQAGGGAGGGMGGANGQQDISEREKEIVAATWKQLGEKSTAPQQDAETAKFLADVQGKLRDQALSLAGRLERRELSEENEEFSGFQQDMNSAAQAMEPASEKLGQQKWKDAMPQEQKALQYLLRAEATFRRIEVAFGNRGGAGGGGGSAGRDLASLFDLELDTEKNQYEVGQTAQSQNQREQDIDDALKKLDELARRQQDLASQQQNAQDYQQRWQQEILRREAEELQRQMEQMSRNGQSGSSNGASGQSGQGGAQGSAQNSQNSTDPRVQQALDQLRQANEDMRRAASQGQGQQNQADARRAAERLREATQLLGGLQNQQGSGQLDSLVREGDRLQAEQRNQEDRLRQAFGRQGQGGSANGDENSKSQQLNQLAGDRQKLGEDLSSLERQMQDTIRQLANGQKPAASKLRDALSGTQQSDLASRLQRSADWIRRGIDPNSNSGEPAIASDLGRLSDQLRQAQQALAGSGQPQGTEQALDRVDRLRDQMEALSRGLDDRAAQNNQSSQGGQGGQGAQAGQNANGNGARTGGATGRGGTIYQGGEYGARAPGIYGGFDPGGYDTPTGSERQPVPVTQADIDRAYEAAVRELNDLRQSAQDKPEQLSDIRDLMRQLQQLDPKRFPGNPAMLNELHTQVLAGVDKLELQLRRDLDKDGQNTGQIRSGDSLTVPSGYEDAVAEYFRRLSNKNP